MSANCSDHIRIVEVGPRDGLQNEKACNANFLL